MRYVRSVCDLKPEFFFLAVNNIHFLQAFGNSLRNNAPPTKLSRTFLFLEISTTLLTLVRHPRQHAIHAGTPPTQACHPRQHATHASTSPKQTRHPHQHEQHAISQTLQHDVNQKYVARKNFQTTPLLLPPLLMLYFVMFFSQSPHLPCVLSQNEELWHGIEERFFCIYDCLMTSSYIIGGRKGQRLQF